MSVEHLRLSQVLSKVKQAVASLGGRDGIWVIAEVLNISNGAHRYLELVEYDENRKEVAKTKGMIWRDRVSMLDDFKKVTGLSVDAGMKILFRAKPVFHEVFGLSLELISLDPTYTLGDMESKIKVIREYLIGKEWFELNRRLPLPADFSRVAVIAPLDAAGLGDFRHEADKLQAHGLCQFDYFHATFQGVKASESIVEQMIAVHQRLQEIPYDALILLRGGGDKAGLYHLNDRRLAASVCRFPIPVMVGIGHERDKVFLEEVAAKRFSTPSLLVSHIKQQIVSNAKQAESNFNRIISLAGIKLGQIEKESEGLYFSLREASLNRVNSIEKGATAQHELLTRHAMAALDKVSGNALRLKDQILDSGKARLSSIEHEAGLLISTVMASNPLAILGKGYGYLQSEGRVITQAHQLKRGDSVTAHLKSFSITSTVEAVHDNPVE